MSTLEDMFSFLLERLDLNDIPYEDAKCLYKNISHFSFSESITRETALRLLKKHNSCWTPEIYSWFAEFLEDPYVSEEEVQGLQPTEDSEYKHILYWYPGLGPMFRASNVITKEDRDVQLGYDFPLIYEEYTPTLEEKVMLTLTYDVYDYLSETEKIADIDNYFFSQLLILEAKVQISSKNLTDILHRLRVVRNCGISEERFLYYLEKDWKNHIYGRLSVEFLQCNWTKEEMLTISEIFSLYPKLQDASNLMRKHGEYARIVSDDRLMKWLLNIPLEYETTKKFLYEKLDIAVSDLKAHGEKVYAQNIETANRLIQEARDLGFEVEDCSNEEVYAYPSGELVFAITDNKFRCYSRINISENPSILEKLAFVNTISPIDADTYTAVGLNVVELFRYYATTEPHRKKMEAEDKKRVPDSELEKMFANMGITSSKSK